MWLHRYLDSTPIMQQLLTQVLLGICGQVLMKTTPNSDARRMCATLSKLNTSKRRAIIASSVPLLRISSIITYLWVARMSFDVVMQRERLQNLPLHG